jgi:hypothetical protein
MIIPLRLKMSKSRTINETMIAFCDRINKIDESKERERPNLMVGMKEKEMEIMAS